MNQTQIRRNFTESSTPTSLNHPPPPQNRWITGGSRAGLIAVAVYTVINSGPNKLLHMTFFAS